MTTIVSTTVTLVSAVRLRPGADGEHRNLHDQAVAAASRLGGLVRAEFIPAIPGVQDESVALLTFLERSFLDAYLASEVRNTLVGQMRALEAGDRTLTVVGDFAGWFADTAPTRWKQALAVVIGLIPVAAVVTSLRSAVLPELPWLASVALVSAGNVAALTWVVMPLFTRALRPWLSR